MKLLTLRLRNLGPLRDFLELDFADGPLARAGLFAITGDTGAGKTTLLDAITLALFGKTARSHESEIISHGAAEGMAELEFEVFGGRFRAKWAQQRKKKSAEMDRPVRELAVFDEAKKTWQTTASTVRELDSTKDRRGKIETELGLNFEQFRRSVMLAQGDFAAFLTADEATRASILERLTDTEIYSDLSKRAFEREKWERKQLAELEAKAQNTKPLEAAERTQLVENQRVMESKNEILKKTAADFRANQTWLLQLFSLQTRAAELEKQTPFFDQKKTEAETVRARLERHRRAEPFSEKLRQLDHFLVEKTSRAAAVLTFENEKTEAENALADGQKKFDLSLFQFDAAKKEAAENEKTFEKVAVLDSRLAAQAEKTEIAAALFQSIFEKNEAAERAILDQKTLAAALVSSLETKKTWLAERPNLAFLPAEFSAIALRVEQLGAALEAGKETKFQLEEAEKRLASAVEKHGSAISDFEKKAAQLADNQRVRVDLLVSADLAEAENPSLELNEKIERGRERLAVLTAFETAATEQKRLLENLADARENFENAGHEADSIQLFLLTFLEQKERLEADFEEKRQLFEREKTFSDFRKRLETGDACPLCGSREHDLAAHAAFLEGDFLEKMSRDFEVAELILDDSKTEISTLEKRLFQLELDRKNALDSAEKIAKLESNLWAKVAEKLPTLEGEKWGSLRLDELAESVLFLTQTIDNQRVTRDALSKIDLKLNYSEREKTTAESDLFRLAAERETAQKEADFFAQKRADLNADFSKKEADLSADFARFGESFGWKNRAENLHQLETVRAAFEKSGADLFEIEKKLAEAERDAAHFSSQFADNQRVMSAAKTDLTAQNFVFETLQNERRELFGDQKIETERAVLIEKLNQFESIFEAARGFLESQKIAAATVAERLLNEKTALENAEKTVEKLASSLEKAIEKAGFENLETLKIEILEVEKALEIEAFLAASSDERARFEQQKSDVSAALFEARKTVFEEKNLEILTQKLAETEGEMQQNLEAIGSAKQQLLDDDERRKKSAAITQTIDNQRLTLKRWADLADLIGSADGKKFRIFAQSLTLERLLVQANKRLAELYGRYELRRRVDKNLELEIVDHFQADAARSMATLSGGETFLASLALALGLADLAGSRRAHIQTLFIDEGFGALDENALATALAALENLQSRGTRIGVISHVKEMKEGIFPQIQVVREGNGTSCARVVAG